MPEIKVQIDRSIVLDLVNKEFLKWNSVPPLCWVKERVIFHAQQGNCFPVDSNEKYDRGTTYYYTFNDLEVMDICGDVMSRISQRVTW